MKLLSTAIVTSTLCVLMYLADLNLSEDDAISYTWMASIALALFLVLIRNDRD